MVRHPDTQKIDVLWVQWFSWDPDHKGRFSTCHLHRIGLMDTEDPSSYRFLDPSDVLHAVYLIPIFSTGRIPSEGADLDRDAMKWQFYYVSM